jgi:hypothetical protein
MHADHYLRDFPHLFARDAGKLTRQASPLHSPPLT